MHLKGTLNSLVLGVLEEGPKHGYWIAQEIKQRSEGVLDFREGTLYPALHGLEAEGHVVAEERMEKGRKRRYYRITPAGKRALSKQRRDWERLSRAVGVILGGPWNPGETETP
ncbi:MAG: PadR family transcriptional regulator [Candidatus Hydrogenedens sp.]|nr:PadR family transcriptional regulator [Candidatus Hydrogenedens sp.]